MNDQKKVFLVDDHPIVRHGMARLISDEEDLVVCGEAGNAPDALEGIERLEPDVLLVDITLGDMSGLDLLKEVRARYATVPVLIVSMHDEAGYLKRALEAGAQGYVNKKDAVRMLVTAVRRVLAGHVYLSEHMMDRLLPAVSNNHTDATATPAEDLTEREREILELIGQGYRARQIAERLQLSPKTVNSHRENIKKKLQLRDASELDRFAIRWVHGEGNVE